MKKINSQNTVDHILEAARSVLLEYGHAGFTTRRVAEAAQISPGNLSYHFPTRQGLLQALILGLVEDYSSQLETFLANAEIPPGQALQNLVRWLLTDAIEEASGRIFRELWAMSLHDEVIRNATDDLYDQIMKHVEMTLLRLQPDAQASSIRELVQFLALMSEGSIVLYGTRKKRAVKFERIIDLSISLLGQIVPELQAPAAPKRRPAPRAPIK